MALKRGGWMRVLRLFHDQLTSARAASRASRSEQLPITRICRPPISSIVPSFCMLHCTCGPIRLGLARFLLDRPSTHTSYRQMQKISDPCPCYLPVVLLLSWLCPKHLEMRFELTARLNAMFRMENVPSDDCWPVVKC